MILVLTYQQKEDQPGSMQHWLVLFFFCADALYTAFFVSFIRGRRIIIASISILLLILTGWMTILSDMWFTNDYL
jgi:hypothetical protein